ncbi:MAG: DUF1287 domain-containing protein [Hyphomicrobiaceae bacterium]|nr:DUF1287 domain-containing protein [Hyphomicrobiaceae bacterium]
MKKQAKGRGKPKNRAKAKPQRREAAAAQPSLAADSRPRRKLAEGRPAVAHGAPRPGAARSRHHPPKASGGPSIRSLSFGSHASDDRFALAVLLAPFLIVALSLGAERSINRLLAQAPRLVIAAKAPAPAARPPSISAADRAELPVKSATGERVAMVDPAVRPGTVGKAPAPPLPGLALLIEPPAPPLPGLALLIEPPAPPLPGLALLIEPPAPPLPGLASLAEPPAHVCPAKPGLLEGRRVPQATLVPPSEPAAFGMALSAAAVRQLAGLVIYNPRYQRIAYPMGDVAPMFGVCTDVIVRAYRELGIDLQALIQVTRSGTGDRNIDHRRVEVVRRFLTRHGKSLPISDASEDYQPGDLVTYHRPQNRSSTSHIALVTHRIAPSGRPMIIHNRGWGPQLEDALFVDRITGHYRFTGMVTAGSASQKQAALGDK